MRYLVSLALGFVITASAQAEDLKLAGKKHWLLLASDKDKDVAIGIARSVHYSLEEARVVLSKNGYYGVIAGPYEAGSIKDLKARDKNERFGELPGDAVLTQGANYAETVWQPAAETPAPVPYSLTKAAKLSSGTLNVTVQGEKRGSDGAYTLVQGKDASGSFHFEIGKDAPADEQASAGAIASETGNTAGLVKLLAKAETPQVVITNYSGGAHCCVETTILARDAGAWSLVKAATLDGGGYGFEDVDGDGGLELVSVDNAFLYAFGSYADSNAPIKIERLSGGKIVDDSMEPAMHGRLVQDLAGMEYAAKLRPALWQSNGFLAGWVASKIRLGEGDAAWSKFMANYEKKSDFGPQTCETGQPIANCPADKLKAVAIPKALAQFLKDNGYTPLPKAAEAELK